MSKENKTSRINRNLIIGIGLNTGFTIFEFIVGILSGSLALVSDAGHNLTDSLGLIISLSANKIAARQANQDKTYGYGRASIVAALLNAGILIVLALFIFFEAYQRIMHPQPVAGGVVAVVAFLGILANGVNAALFVKDLDDLNIRSAFVGMFFDTLASVGALIAGLVILFAHQTLADPLASILIGIMLLFSTWKIIEEALHILLEGTPKGINVDLVKELIKSNQLVQDVDDLHIWSISSHYAALSCHIVIDECVVMPSS